MPTDQERLTHLFRAQHTCVSIVTFEEDDALQIVRDVGMGRTNEMWLWSCSVGTRDGLVSRAAPLPNTEHAAAALTHLLDLKAPTLAVMLDLAGHLSDEKTLRLLRDVIDRFGRYGSHLVLIDHKPDLPPVIKALATPFELSLPDEATLSALVKDTLRACNEVKRITVEIDKPSLQAIHRNLRGLTPRQARQIIVDATCEDMRFDANDVNTVLARKRKILQGTGALEYVEAPVSLDEIGGLRALKTWLGHRQNAVGEDAAAFGLSPPRGVLMLGVQGAGKSLSAKAVATAWRRPLLRMDVGALYDKYIGETERQLRDALKQAETMAPIVLWIDEIEKAFASTTSNSSDGGLSKRMFATLLTWMQEHTAPVFLIATANDIEALPPELLRKGRFDEIFFVDLPDAAARAAIFRIHLAKRKRDPKTFDVAALAAASDGFSGAEIEQAVVSGLHEAFAAKAELSTSHILEALRTSPPLSVTMAERVAGLRQWARGRCVPAN
jgi:AAA+ superfamily predicted ATPase